MKSTKPSAASSGLPELTFFVDRSLGRQLVANALRLAGESVEIHDDHFAPDAPDDVWLTAVGQRGWIALTKDKAIRFRKNERAAVQSANARLFVLTAGNITGAECAAAIVAALPAIRKLVFKASPPFIATVSRAGNVSLLA